MIQAILLTFLAGLMTFNGMPHFVQGISAREYPNLTGNSPIRNAVGGLVAFVIAGALIVPAHVAAHPWPAAIAGLLGAAVMTVFHAGGGAFRLNRRFGKPMPKA
ncbi:hypothetical protein [Kribbella jiaozuonensis]|uniref:Uncharacterized protein n=1 Tax=Kribbella jiaozuonensis TaxID=2575441 RepID=A0A4V5UX60_9ACTN|nr:hypothetical protein [Kribbella jiaozuonensis]TKK78383.1 hypothetical protein FDA38_25275 [Kribbella jiaozuonensis]